MVDGAKNSENICAFLKQQSVYQVEGQMLWIWWRSRVLANLSLHTAQEAGGLPGQDGLLGGTLVPRPGFSGS